MRPCAIAILLCALAACGSAQATESPAADDPDQAPAATTGSETEDTSAEQGAAQEFAIQDSDSAKTAHGVEPSQIKGTQTEAALKFFVIDTDKGPLPGIVISLTGPNGEKFYTQETDAQGFAEVLVPIARSYDLVYLSLGRRDVAARVTVTDKPKQNIKLTMRYKRIDPPGPSHEPRFVLDGVTFDSGSATIRPDAAARLDSVVEYMVHKPAARIEISGHTDNVGNPKVNKALSLKRAQACRDYVIGKGIDASRITAVGHGDERPYASNDTPSGREQNRRIEATEAQ